MKKIFSVVLMAVALLVGTNSWAQSTISVVYHNGVTAPATFSDLQTAINSVAAGDSATITLKATQMLTKGIVIPNVTSAATDAEKIANRAGQRICIDLNGYDIKTSSMIKHSVFSLLKGTLRITGEGRVERANVAKGSSNWERGAIIVSGTDGRDASLGIDASHPDRSKQEWSVLYIDENVEVVSEYSNTYGIGIQEFGPNYPSWGTSEAVWGYKTYYKGDNATGSEEKAPMWTKNSSKAQYSAFGVKVIIAGTVYGHTRGINVVGNINQTPSDAEGHSKRTKDVYPYYDRNYPYILIKSTADVSCIDQGISSNGNGGIYAAGWAILDIHGAVHGQTGIFMKSGDVKVLDGNVYSDAPTASNSGNYHGDVAGSGIFIASDAGYAGEASVSVEGDSRVAGAGGSAIVDVVAANTTETQVSHVEITGGTIEGGDQGAINITTGTQAQTEVTGGSVEGTIKVGADEQGQGGTTVSVTTLVPDNDDYHTTSITDPETGKTTVVVSQGAAPTGDANVAEGHDKDSRVQWTGASETISADLSLKELEINESTAQALTIAADKTLTVERLVLGPNATVTVEAGAKLLVTGTQGITANSVENIVLKTNNEKQAMLLVNPAVKSGRHPKAQVELYSVAKYNGGSSYTWQRFGVPAYKDDVTFDEIDKNYGGGSYKSAFEKLVNGAWENVLPENWEDETLAPFTAYSVTTTKPAAGTIYTFSCELVGNDNATLSLSGKWNYFANSYTAPINIKKVITDFAANYTNVSGTIYLHDPVNNRWYEINNLTSVFNKSLPKVISPMYAFAIHRREEGSNPVVNYENAVYNPVLGIAAAPAREASATSFATAVIEIVAADGTKDQVNLVEGDQFSAEFDNSYDAEKLMNNNQSYIFANGKEENLGIIATDNLEGTKLSMNTKDQTSFMMTVSNVNGMNYAIRDMLTGTQIDLAEGATYMFSVPANTTVDGRFQIVGAHKVATAIDNAVEEEAAVKGIYNMAGQYMGTDYHSLPAGVYLVDGKKVVK